MATSILLVPHFITAEGAVSLRRLMIETNLKNKKRYDYFDIQWVQSERRWYAWYYETLKPDEELKELKIKIKTDANQ